jgi:transcription termination/antitermination protein NusG
MAGPFESPSDDSADDMSSFETQFDSQTSPAAVPPEAEAEIEAEAEALADEIEETAEVLAEAIAESIEDETGVEVPDEAVDELAEEIAEEITAEVVEEVIEEVVEELVIEELAEELAEAAIAEEVAEEIAEEIVEASEQLADAELIEVEVDAPDASPVRADESPFERPGRWYVVHTYAGYENKVKSNLASRVRSMAVEDRIFEVVIPMEDVIEFKNGRKVVVQKKVFPGYLLVRMDLDDHAWYVVRNTPGVTGFVGSGAKPTPLSRKEVEDILGTGEKIEGPTPEKKVRPRLAYDIGEQVRVVTGPFADFNGVISEIDVDRSKLKVLVNIFGRETPVELEFGDVAKL